MLLKTIISFVTRLSSRERIIFYATVGIIGLVLLDRIILSPILNKINGLGEAIRVMEETIDQSLLIVTQEKRIEEESLQFTSFLSAPQTEEKTITAFLQEVETLAKKSSVYLIDIKPSGRREEGAIVRHFVKLDFEAQMEEVFNFFHSMANYESLIKIEGYQVQPKSVGSTVITCSMSISKTIIPQ